MTIFGDFLRRVRIKSIKVGPVTWEIKPTDGSAIQAVAELPILEDKEKERVIDSYIQELDDLVDRLNRFSTRVEGERYIGQTLVRCDSFLDDNGIVGEPLELTMFLIDELDSDTRASTGYLEPILSVAKLNRLKRLMKALRAEIIRFQEAEQDNDFGQPTIALDSERALGQE